MSVFNAGLEIHIYPRTECKMYCDCSASVRDAEPNSNICPICTGQPGSKPLPPNIACIEAGIVLSSLLGMHVSEKPVATLRKHYFYPDLPSNYQRTGEAFASGGQLRDVRFREMHWEEDPGQYDISKGTVDFNRSGLPLLELVTEPDLHTVPDLKSFLQDFKLLLDYLEIARTDTPFKIDTNVSIGSGERVEIKNVNSISGVIDAVSYEVQRQTKITAEGRKVSRETMHFDDLSRKTVSLRYKETSDDYRYMADPDILPADLSTLHPAVPRNPFLIIKEMESDGVRPEDARTIVSDRNLLHIYGNIAAGCGALFASRFVARDIKAELNYRRIGSTVLKGTHISSSLAKLASVYSAGGINNLNATMLLRKIFDNCDISHDIELLEGNWVPDSRIMEVAKKIIDANHDAVARYRQGKKETINFLAGLCMRELKNLVKPQEVIRVLHSLLDG